MRSIRPSARGRLGKVCRARCTRPEREAAMSVLANSTRLNTDCVADSRSVRRRPPASTNGPAMRYFALCAGLLTISCFSGCISTKARLPNADIAPDEKAAVLAVIDGFFESMAAPDTATFAAFQTPDGMTYSQRMESGQWVLMRRSNQQWIDAHRQGSVAVAETYWEPTVMIR